MNETLKLDNAALLDIKEMIEKIKSVIKVKNLKDDYIAYSCSFGGCSGTCDGCSGCTSCDGCSGGCSGGFTYG